MPIDCRVALALCACLAAAAQGARAADPPLFPCQELPFAGDANAAAHADWNNDGKLDVAVTGVPFGIINFKGVTLQFGDGAGNFPSRVTRTLSSYSRDVAAADVDGDGRMDLVTLYGPGGGLGGIEVAKNGIAGLGAGANYVVDDGAANLAAGDFTNDGRPDLVCTTDTFSIVDVLVNDGTGAFPIMNQVTGIVIGKEIALGDFDVDGNLDFAVTQFNTTTVAAALYGDGAGHFPRKRVSISTYTDHFSLCSGDFNADGHTDLAAGDGDGSNVFQLRVLVNNAFPGAINSFLPAQILTDTTRVMRVRAPDVDADGAPDLVVESEGIEVRRNIGGATFGAPKLFDPISVYKGGFTLADFDTDGDLDLVAGGAFEAVVMLGLGGGSFEGGTHFDVTGGAEPADLAFSDFNGDGLPDGAVALGGLPPVVPSNAVAILANDGEGGLVQTSTLIVDLAPLSLDCGDLDHDSDQDLVVACAGGIGLDVSLGDGHGAFATPTIEPLPSGANAVVLGDVDQDGNLDALCTVPSPKKLAVFRGLGAAGFAAPAFYSAGNGLLDLSLADLDADGDLDVACSLQTTSQVALLMNGPAGTFSAPQTITVGGNAQRTAAADFDGNGFADVAVSCSASHEVTLLPNLGGGAFGAAVHLFTEPEYTPFADVTGLAVRDLDGDGAVDVVMSESYPDRFVVFENDGGFAFTRSRFAAHSSPQNVAIVDLDSDGKPDVVTCNAFENVTVARNRRPEPAGLEVYGHGTPGCFGPHWLLGNSSPAIGNAGFTLRAGRGQPFVPTWLMIGTQPDVAGSGLALIFHLQLASIALITAIPNGADGELVVPAPIPPVPAWAGVTAYVQAIPYWPSGPCLPSTFKASSTPGLKIVLQP